MKFKQHVKSIVFYMNLLFYIITLSIPIYYSDIHSGMFIQFWLGTFQLMLGFYFLTINKNIYPTIATKTQMYWLLVVIYFISLPIVLKLQIQKEIYSIGLMVIVPMSIGLFNLHINYLIQKK